MPPPPLAYPDDSSMDYFSSEITAYGIDTDFSYFDPERDEEVGKELAAEDGEEGRGRLPGCVLIGSRWHHYAKNKGPHWHNYHSSVGSAGKNGHR